MKVYRTIAVLMIVVGLYFVVAALYGAISDSALQFPIHCSTDDCRAILPDGSIGGAVIKPEGGRHGR